MFGIPTPGCPRGIYTYNGSEYDVVATNATGSCFFDCVAMFVKSGPFSMRLRKSMSVRHTIVDYVIGNWERFGPYTSDHTLNAFQNSDSYSAYMRMPSSYACNAEIMSAALVYDISLVVLSPEKQVLFSHESNTAGVPTLMVLFSGEGPSGHGGHYELLQVRRRSLAAVVKGNSGHDFSAEGFWSVWPEMPPTTCTPPPLAACLPSRRPLTQKNIDIVHPDNCVRESSTCRTKSQWTTVTRRKSKVQHAKQSRADLVDASTVQVCSVPRPSNPPIIKRQKPVTSNPKPPSRETDIQKIFHEQIGCYTQQELKAMSRRSVLQCQAVSSSSSEESTAHKHNQSASLKRSFYKSRRLSESSSDYSDSNLTKTPSCKSKLTPVLSKSVPPQNPLPQVKPCSVLLTRIDNGIPNKFPPTLSSKKAQKPLVKPCSVRLERLPHDYQSRRNAKSRPIRLHENKKQVVPSVSVERPMDVHCANDCDEDVDDPSFIVQRHEEGLSDDCIQRVGPHRVPPNTHNRKKGFTSWTIKRSHGQKSQYVAFAWTYPGENPEQNMEPLYVGAIDEMKCPHCGACYFWVEATKAGAYTSCCKGGKIKCPPLKTPSQPIADLYTADNDVAKLFRDNIRTYNNLLAFGNTVVNSKAPSGRGPWGLVVNGEVKHMMSWGVPDVNVPEKHDQMYFIEDLGESVLARMKRAESLQRKPDRSVLRLLEQYIRHNNPFARSMLMFAEVLRERTSRDMVFTNVTLAINPVPKDLQWRKRHGPLSTRYFGDTVDMPQCNDVATVFVGDCPPMHYDVRVTMRLSPDGHPLPVHKEDRILSNCKSVDQLCYPLLHLHGEGSWNESTSDVQRGRGTDRVPTLNEYYRYRTQVREKDWSPLHIGSKLTCQYLIDAAAKIQDDRIRYIRQHRQKNLLRSESAKVLMKHINQEAAKLGKPVGRIFILPVDFPGGEKFMNKQYLDAMRVLEEFGKPDLFITYSANPRWKEIDEAMQVGGYPDFQHLSEFRPDIVMRVFAARFNVFMADLLFHQALGEIVAYVLVMEFQKRGLPHCHIIAVLKRQWKLRTPEQIDAVISAELPNPAEEPVLYDLVKRHMIHRPCHKTNPDQFLSCHRPDPKDPSKTICRFLYPKDLRAITSIGRGEIKYRRRDTDFGFVIQEPQGGVLITNHNVSPHNKRLLLRHECHINVQVYNSATAVKYLYKYVYKGPARVYKACRHIVCGCASDVE